VPAPGAVVLRVDYRAGRRGWSDWQLFGKFSHRMALRPGGGEIYRLIHVIVGMLTA